VARSLSTTDRALTVIDGIEFEVLNVGFAWSTDDAALNDAQHVIDRMRTSRLIQGMQR
jgi:hypothetical protein